MMQLKINQNLCESGKEDKKNEHRILVGKSRRKYAHNKRKVLQSRQATHMLIRMLFVRVHNRRE
jgi:hypothetical protein